MSQDLPSSLTLKVVTPRRLLVDEDVQMVTIPGLNGELGILPGHKPLLVAVGKGKLSYNRAQSSKDIAIQGGYVEILPHRVLVFTEMIKDEFNGQD